MPTENQKNPKVQVINGPNLNLLGMRDPAVYGTASLLDIEHFCADYFNGLPSQTSPKIEFFQSNVEGEIINMIQSSKDCRGVVINAGALSHTSHAIADAVRDLRGIFGVKVVEVHLTNIFARDPFRHNLCIADAVDAVIFGAGALGYRLAIEYILEE